MKHFARFFTLFLFLFAIPAMATQHPAALELCPELTTGQKIIGALNWTGFLEFFFFAGIAASALYLFRHYVMLAIELFAHIPKEFYEILLYVLAFALIVGGLFVENGYWFGFLGCLFFLGALLLSIFLHKLDGDSTGFFMTLFTVYTIVALLYQSSLIGFLSVGALLGVVGFSTWVIPGCIFLGFKDDDAIGRGTATAFLILALYVFIHIVSGASAYVLVFEKGAIWLGGLAFYLGLSIVSMKWYDHKFSYPVMQVLIVVACLLGTAIGSIWDIGPLNGIAAFFLVLWALEKPYEIPWKSRLAYAWVTFFTCSIGGTLAWTVQNHFDSVVSALPFLK